MVSAVFTDRLATEIMEVVSAAPTPPVCVNVQALMDGTRRLAFEAPLTADLLEKLEEFGCTPDY